MSSSFWENKIFSHPITFWSRNRLITTARVNNSSLKPNRFFDFKDLSTQKKDWGERYGVGKHFLSSFWENKKKSGFDHILVSKSTDNYLDNSSVCALFLQSSDSKISVIRRAIGTSDTVLERIFALLPGEIKIYRIRSHFDLKTNQSSE